MGIQTLTIQQAAHALNVSYRSVYRYVEYGWLGPVMLDASNVACLDKLAVCKFLARTSIEFPPAAKVGRPVLGDRKKTPAQRKAAWKLRQKQRKLLCP
jgi:hypothetical protein